MQQSTITEMNLSKGREEHMKPTVFAVEDDEDFAKFLAKSLQKGGYELAGVAPSGEEALKQIAALRPGLVLMDMNLTGRLDGIETAEQIRTHHGLPVIFLTASDDEALLHRAKHTEPFGYLGKPFRQQDLVSAIEIAFYKHQVEQKLKQREAWLATTLRSAGDGMVVTDSVGRVEFLNEIAKRILGIEETEVVGKKLSDIVHLKSRLTGAAAGDLVQLAILHGRTMDIGGDLSLTGSLHGEAELEGEISLSEVAGVIVGTVFTFRDTTLRNHQEEQHRQGLRRRAVTQLAGVISAELKQVRQAALASTQQLFEQVDAGHPMRPSVESMRTEYVDAMSRVLHQLGTLQRKETAFPRVLDLNALIAETCAGLQLDLPPSIELTAQLNPELGKIVADPAHIKQALVGLILHLRDSLPRGGKIALTTRNCGLEGRGRTAPADRFLRLTIASSGVAPSAALAEESGLFEPFARANSLAENLDLRLFGIHGVIAEARGSISAQAKPGQGLSFEIVLPQRPEQVDQQIAPAGKRSGPAQPSAAAVLLIEKDNDIRDLVLSSLEENGVESLGARDAQEALEWIDLYAAPIGLLITELEMAEMSGLAVAERLSVRHPGMRALFVADPGTSPQLRREWKNRGRFIERPFRLNDLLGVVNEMLAAGDAPAPPVTGLKLVSQIR